jgi:hypothetical protein
LQQCGALLLLGTNGPADRFAKNGFMLQVLRLSLIAVALSGSLLLAGCGGGGTSPVAAPTASPTPVVFTFTSAGGTANISSGPSGSGTLTSGAPVGGVSITSTWGANGAIAPVAMTAQVATGTGDITSNSALAFPPFTVATAVDSSGAALTGVYTAVDYVKFTATPDTVFTQTPGIAVTIGAPASIAGKTSCSYFGLNLTTLTWAQLFTAAPSGNTIAFAAQAPPSGSVVEVGNGSTNVVYLALACK